MKTVFVISLFGQSVFHYNQVTYVLTQFSDFQKYREILKEQCGLEFTDQPSSHGENNGMKYWKYKCVDETVDVTILINETQVL